VRLYDVHHFILQLEKNVSPDECFIALDNFMSSIIDYYAYHPSLDPEYLFLKKSHMLEQLTAKMKHIQTNNHLFLIISE